RLVRRTRQSALEAVHGGLRALYRVLELPGKHPLKEAHEILNAAVLDTYGFRRDRPVLDQLLELNDEIARRESAKEPVTSPGIPRDYGDSSRLRSEDCIRPA